MMTFKNPFRSIAGVLFCCLLHFPGSSARARGNEPISVGSPSFFSFRGFGSQPQETTNSGSYAFSNAGLDNNPYETSVPGEKSWKETWFPALFSALTTLYGSALVAYARDCPSQLRGITMFRATGYDKLLKGIEEAKRNFRDAKFAAIYRVPSFYFARRSLKALDKRVALHKKKVERTRQAKQDGVVTPAEAKSIAKLEKEQMRLLKNDMKRLVQAGSDLGAIFKALDFDELKDITKSFMFQLLAVLSAGDESKATGLGVLVGRWCLFLNLGGLVLDASKRLNFPIARLLVKLKIDPAKVKLKGSTSEMVANTGKAIMYSVSGYLVVAKNTLARRLNSAFLSSAVVLRGLRGFVQTMLDWDDDDDDGAWPWIARTLDGYAGGLIMVGLTALSWYSQQEIVMGSSEQAPVSTPGGELSSPARRNIHLAPNWIKTPLLKLEKGIDTIADKVDNIL